MAKEIELTQGKVAIVDDADYAWLTYWKWHCTKGYAARHTREDGRDHKEFMHRVILDAQRGVEVDHIDGDPLNNTQANLRLCTHAENMRNLRRKRTANAPYKGVSWDAKKQKFIVAIGSGKRNKATVLAQVIDPLEGAKIYDAAAIELFGEFAALNFPQE